MVVSVPKEIRRALQRERALNDQFRRSGTAFIFYSPGARREGARAITILVREIKRPRWRYGWPMHYRDHKEAGGGGKHLNLHDFATIAIDGVQYVWEIKGGMREADSGKWDGTRKLYISTFEDAQAALRSPSHTLHEGYWERFPTYLDGLGEPRGLEALMAEISRRNDSPD